MNCSEKISSLEFTLIMGCRLNCYYCPQKMLLETYFKDNNIRKRCLTFSDFVKVLEKVEDGATLSFAGMSEPFHNSECADMLVYAYEKGFKIALLTTLVGMTKEDYYKIKDIQFDSLVLHIPDEEGNSKFVIDEQYLELLKLVNDTMDIDYYSCHGSVHPLVQDIIDKDKFAGISVHNRAGNLEVTEVKSRTNRCVEGEIVCYCGSETQTAAGMTHSMLPDGTLVLCCQDYGMKHILGNLIEQSWMEIKEGIEYKKIAMGMKDSSIDILCRNCDTAIRIEDLPAMRLKRAVENVEETLKEDFLQEQDKEIIRVLAESSRICVFGIGKLFRDHFWYEHWNDGLNATLLSDNNSNTWGTEINGLKCVSPNELKQEDCVVVFVKKGDEIIKQLKEMGIENCILFNDVFRIAISLCKGKFCRRKIEN